MPLGLVVRSGRILTAKLLLGEATEGITHCAIGAGDQTFVDPKKPPAPDVNQTGLKHECARKRFSRHSFLKEDPNGTLLVNGVSYLETDEESNIIGFFFRFDETEVNGITIKEYGFFGGGVQYTDGVDSDLALNGVFNKVYNRRGQVFNPGYLYEIKNIPDFNKIADTRIELVGIIRI